MEGLYFYWLAWIGWIWTTFFMDKKNPARLKIAFWLLAAILAAPYNYKMLNFDYHLSGIIIAIFLFIETKGMKMGAFLNLFFSAFIMMLAYTSFLMFELFDPAWVLVDRKILIAAVGVCLGILLQKNDYDRALLIISGFLQGEILYSAILWKFHFPYLISSLAFLDTLAVSMAILVAGSALKSFTATISRSAFNQAEGEGHKTS